MNGVGRCINFETDMWGGAGNNIVQDYNYSPFCH